MMHNLISPRPTFFGELEPEDKGLWELSLLGMRQKLTFSDEIFENIELHFKSVCC